MNLREFRFAFGLAAASASVPHRVVVFHDPQAKTSNGNDDATRKNFAEYGQRLERMLLSIQADSNVAVARM